MIEFASFGQYFTTLISDVVGKKGMVYMYDLPYTETRAGAASRAFACSAAQSPAASISARIDAGWDLKRRDGA